MDLGSTSIAEEPSLISFRVVSINRVAFLSAGRPLELKAATTTVTQTQGFQVSESVKCPCFQPLDLCLKGSRVVGAISSWVLFCFVLFLLFTTGILAGIER